MLDNISDEYVYKKEVDWSLFNYGFAIPIKHQVVFRKVADRFLERGESKEITLYLNGVGYKARINNNTISAKFGDHADIVQIRYSQNSEIAQVLRACFQQSYNYINQIKCMQEKGSKKHIVLPDEYKEYLAIYTTEYDDTYVLETISADDVCFLREMLSGQSERTVEAEFSFDSADKTAGIIQKERIVKIRKLNRKIGENLKQLYEYRCQICGRSVGKAYDAHIAEAHHIDYFVKSLNNDESNIMIVCPDHHSVIHDVNPMFDRKRLMYHYYNGLEERLLLNKHLK